MPAQVLPTKVYLRTGAALLVLLVLTVAAGKFDLGPASLLIAMAIAVVKAGLVGMFFMHLRYRRGVFRLFAGVGLIWLFIMVFLTLADVLHRGWLGAGSP